MHQQQAPWGNTVVYLTNNRRQLKRVGRLGWGIPHRFSVSDPAVSATPTLNRFLGNLHPPPTLYSIHAVFMAIH